MTHSGKCVCGTRLLQYALVLCLLNKKPAGPSVVGWLMISGRHWMIPLIRSLSATPHTPFLYDILAAARAPWWLLLVHCSTGTPSQPPPPRASSPPRRVSPAPPAVAPPARPSRTYTRAARAPDHHHHHHTVAAEADVRTRRGGQSLLRLHVDSRSRAGHHDQRTVSRSVPGARSAGRGPPRWPRRVVRGVGVGGVIGLRGFPFPGWRVGGKGPTRAELHAYAYAALVPGRGLQRQPRVQLAHHPATRWDGCFWFCVRTDVTPVRVVGQGWVVLLVLRFDTPPSDLYRDARLRSSY